MTMFYKKRDGTVVPVSPGPQGPQGDPGPAGPAGPPGGAVLSGWWTYSSTTTGPATTGQVRTSSGLDTVGEQGTIWISSTDSDGLDWSLVAPSVGDTVVLRSSTGETWILTVDAIPTAGEWTVTLDSATTVAPKKNQPVQVSLVRASSGGGEGGVTDHGALTGLGDDDHPQYVKKSGDTMTGSLVINGASGPQTRLILTPQDGTIDDRAWRLGTNGQYLWVTAMLDNGTTDMDFLRFDRTTGQTLVQSTSLTVPVPTAAGHAARKENVDAKVDGLNGATGLWVGTQTEYDAIGTPDASTVYVIT